MKTPNAGIESFETKAPETWRPPSRSSTPRQSFRESFREVKTLPPPRRGELPVVVQGPESSYGGSLGELELEAREAELGELESGWSRAGAIGEQQLPWDDLAAMVEVGGLGEVASPWQQPEGLPGTDPSLGALPAGRHEARAPATDLALSAHLPVPAPPAPKDLRPSLLELGLSIHEIECFSPLAARLSSHQIVSAAQAILTSRPRAPGACDTTSSPPTHPAGAERPPGPEDAGASARTRETARPPVRRLRDTQRPGQRRPSESVRPSPSLRTMEGRRFPSRPAVAPAPASGWRVSAPAPAASRSSAAPSCEQTTCGGCHATTPTQRVSTLSSIGWRPSSFPECALAQQWLCPKCRQVAALSTPPAAERKA
ncbi:MAG TPA: hypothetical protein VEK07_07365 [Polyangiaceae bacterium]|nr:hypothetical protein [Polyangiaceae bacterium]